MNMLFGVFLSIFAVVLVIYIIRNWVKTRNFTTSDALAALGIIVAVLLAWAFTSPASSPITPTPLPTFTLSPNATSTHEPGIFSTSTLTNTTNFYQVSISRISQLTEPKEMLSGLLKPGLQDLLGIPFDIGWQTTTQCDFMADRPTQLSLDTFVPRPINVYIILSGTGKNQKDGEQVGIIRLTFSDGWSFDTSVRFGVNIRYWVVLGREPDRIVTTTSPFIREAKRGPVYLPPPEDITVTGIIDVLTIPIAERQQADLTRIEILDTTVEKTGLVDPCMHVSGITVEYRRE
jgi:hypothetical protein